MIIIMLNNIDNPITNTIINNMLKIMNLFDSTSHIGNGLKWRSMHTDSFAQVLLRGVIFIELVIDKLT